MFNDRSKPYTAAGVNLSAGNALVSKFKELAATTKTNGVKTEIGGFGGLFQPNLSGMKEPLLVASTDGVGTKLKLAIAYGRHETVGIDLVAMSANDILVQGASPLFFLDYYACGKLNPAICETVVAGIANGCQQAGCALLGGETAEMPGMYSDDDYDLAGFCVGIVDNSKLIDGSEIQNGDAIIGIASSGIHSNGYSLVRKILSGTGLNGDDPFPGKAEKSVADVLLTPTTIYVKAVLPLLRDLRIKGMVHITGGGFYDNVPRILPDQVIAEINFGTWSVPPVFEWLKTEGNLTWSEMLQIFNCGIGFVIVAPEDQADEVINRINAFELGAWKIGHIEKRSKPDNTAASEQVYINHTSD